MVAVVGVKSSISANIAHQCAVRGNPDELLSAMSLSYKNQICWELQKLSNTNKASVALIACRSLMSVRMSSHQMPNE